MSWYKTTHTFTKQEQSYLKILTDIFRVQNQRRQWVDYEMTDYQKEYHADSINIKMEESVDILFIKARGISFTWSTLIDLIMTGVFFNGVVIPVIAQREKTALQHIKTAQEIIKNCKNIELIQNVKFTNHSITFLETGSVMEAYPSSSASDTVRGLRLITGLVDEYAFQDNAEALLAAFQETIQGDLGQLKIGSTPCGRGNKFHELIDSAKNGKDIGFKIFELPVFDPTKFNSYKDPIEQDIEPIAPWISIKALSTKWKRGREIFLQENMCDFLDDSLSLIKYTTIMKSVNDKLQNHRDVYRRNAEFIYNTNNPIYFGVDVAEKTDYFAVSGYEEIVTSDGRVYYIERWLDYFNNTETPELEKYLDVIFEIYPTLVKMRIDSTGLGSYLPSYLKKRHGGKVEGINFARTVFAEDGKEKVGIKKIMCTNLKRLLEDDQVILLPDEMQSKHLGAVDYSFSVKKGVEGHGDIFFSNALALLKSRYSVGKQEVQMNTPQQKEQDISKMGVLERIKYYKKKGGKI